MARRRALGGALALAGALAVAGSAPPASCDALAPLVEALAQDLPPEAKAALGAIDGAERRLLAARSYLRAGRALAERWSWSAAQIAAYEGSAEQRDALAEVAKVAAAFAAAYPGYTLYVNQDVRPLEVQVERWNESPSVAAVAAELAEATRAQVGERFDPADSRAVARLREFLVAWHSSAPPPALAAPGLSPHGQGRAFDFQIQQGDRLVAGASAADVEQAWDAAGWTEKLRAAVTSASARFQGPLEMPREPWHYGYVPPSDASLPE